ncbi:MAG: flagellar biosynthesis protein FlgD [Gemmatimonadetes bacterium]|nr:flagellar biosynthesis protein FlgD [Gemmatimonadota bacterium]
MITSANSTASSGSALAAAAQPAVAAGGAMGKDQFMKLLIAQMQNQDPTNPMDGSQMASQLAQFSSLEQLQQINTTLTGQQSSNGTLLGAMQASSAINTIGHTVVAAGNGLQIGGANGATNVAVDVSGAAKSGTLHIFNAAGNEVGKRDLGALSAGKQSVDIGSASSGLPAGTYTYSVDAKDSAGAAVAVQTYVTGRVDGISTGANGLVLTSGGLTIPYANIVQILN